MSCLEFLVMLGEIFLSMWSFSLHLLSTAHIGFSGNQIFSSEVTPIFWTVAK